MKIDIIMGMVCERKDLEKRIRKINDEMIHFYMSYDGPLIDLLEYDLVKPTLSLPNFKRKVFEHETKKEVKTISEKEMKRKKKIY